LPVQRMQRLPDRGLVETHCRLPVRFLIAGVDKGVQGER
jgi:hypothetical protein